MRSTALCLTCSSSLLPKYDLDLFMTECCGRPICPACINSNPRLRTYNPCLSCLGGVNVVSSASARRICVANNSTVRDEDIFILGDEEEDEDEAHELASVSPISDPAPPSYSLAVSSTPSLTSESILLTQTSDASPGHAEVAATGEQCIPSRYYINPRDTLQGISLRYGVNGRELCRLNNLPPSTLSTTPHLLHTRTFIILPPSAKSLSVTRDADLDAGVRRVREKAEKRLQMLTKEVDWRVAKAYVSLADDPDEEAMYGRKYKETGSIGTSTLEARAADQYLEDQEWEEEQRRAGKRISVKSLPLLQGKFIAYT
ncbi:hypothetical protein DEU56DRAFT_735311 [Suillus clintonianus]|uniref:uncharacterized protein n=1 Tax=Suillus clintonianus TaxID=1904413 RepID=UPI001B87A43C|nr:uncharacterized protein DEU56DRAFT_735311 [Suillus clintonianus]KAG2140081.1 hypothetical protein DEU56DRAFT_735311 [Suillus clintonianus]